MRIGLTHIGDNGGVGLEGSRRVPRPASSRWTQRHPLLSGVNDYSAALAPMAAFEDLNQRDDALAPTIARSSQLPLWFHG